MHRPARLLLLTLLLPAALAGGRGAPPARTLPPRRSRRPSGNWPSRRARTVRSSSPS
ncbi:hypothetical protein LAJ19_03945 [Deinococcus taeanensis]|uniref:hypothetical protein n=1 Tax=Deinococcus taeanensis TaxID=2737050 RepID=UPI001CDC5488|nr:hypothetical protein [Deinococcus taeanensis]UBV43375.1 hypothetical protein LAJ19_03945 [Deinococcus taeanensis]